MDGVSSTSMDLYEKQLTTSVNASNVEAYSPTMVINNITIINFDHGNLLIISTITADGAAPSAIMLAASNAPLVCNFSPAPPKTINDANVPNSPAKPPPNTICLIERPFDILAIKNGVATHHAIQYAQ